MANQDWNPIVVDDRSTWPPDGEVVSTMDSGGHVQPLMRKGTLFWFPDMSMYVYYAPKFWQKIEKGAPTNGR